MMTKLWERLLGYDKWIETTATFEAADVQKTPHHSRDGSVSYTYTSFDTILWADQSGATHRADFKVPDDSPIYQMVDGNQATIRYDPTQPDRFYYPDLFRTRIATVLQRIGYTILFLVILTLFIALHIWLSH
jgi:hypothetical protein